MLRNNFQLRGKHRKFSSGSSGHWSFYWIKTAPPHYRQSNCTDHSESASPGMTSCILLTQSYVISKCICEVHQLPLALQAVSCLYFMYSFILSSGYGLNTQSYPLMLQVIRCWDFIQNAAWNTKRGVRCGVRGIPELPTLPPTTVAVSFGSNLLWDKIHLLTLLSMCPVITPLCVHYYFF